MISIRQVSPADVPYDLLFLADEDDEQISKYRNESLFWMAEFEDVTAGMIGLNELSTTAAEIVCLAVYEKYENKKIGTELIEQAIEHCKKKEYKEILIKTGNCGMKQIYLYQRCGFRMDSINKDYFKRNYKVPIYENFLQCIDQIILKYTLYSEEELKKIVGDYWNRFITTNPLYADSQYETWNFCYGSYLPDKLIGLVKEGIKTGTSSAAEAYDIAEKKPEVGDISVITYGNGLPGCIIRTEEIQYRPFKEITEEEARLEGEGDLSLNYWRRVHEDFFSMEYKHIGKEFNENIPVIFETFKVIYDEDRR